MTNTTHTLELLVEETRQELSSVEAELVAVREQAALLHDKAAVLREEHASFLAALRRRVPASEGEAVAALEASEDQGDAPLTEWQAMDRTSAVEKALAAIQPAGPAEIQKYLSDVGRDDGRDLISAALAHLKRSGRAWRGGRSQWATHPFPTDTSGPDLSGPEGDVTATGSGGNSHAQADQDHGDYLARWDRADRGGASVEAST